jgi:hypothetical protein
MLESSAATTLVGRRAIIAKKATVAAKVIMDECVPTTE